MNRIKILVVAILTLSVGAYVFSPSRSKTTNGSKANATVKITNLAETGGGTGVILDSGTVSHVLTNNHICEMVKKTTSQVITDLGTRYPIFSLKQSIVHDLCLLTIQSNLGVNTSLATSAPSLYDEAIIAGHPSLLPTIITKGHFSGKQLGTVLIGIRKCTPADEQGPLAPYCMFLGGIPIIRAYEMQIVSATIQPGSSGSAVYNGDGQLAGLVFAGSGGFGYAMIVPYEYIVNFLYNELPVVESVTPSASQAELTESLTNVKETCRTTTNPLIKTVCDRINKSRTVDPVVHGN